MLTKTKQFLKSFGFSGLLELLAPYLSYQRRPFMIGMCGVIGIIASVLLLGQAIQQAYQLVNDFSWSLSNLWKVWLLVIGLASCSFLRSYGFACFALQTTRQLKIKLFSHLLRLESSFYDQQGTARVFNQWQKDMATLEHFLRMTVNVTLRNIFLLLGGMAFLLRSSPILTLLVFLEVPLVILPAIWLLRRYRQSSSQSVAASTTESTWTAEIFFHLTTVKAFTYEKAAIAQLHKLALSSLLYSQQRFWLKASLSALLIILGALTIISIVNFGLYYASYIAVSNLIAFLFYAVVVAATLVSLGALGSQWQQAGLSAGRLLAWLKLSPLNHEKASAIPLKGGTLAIRQLSFAYCTNPHAPVLKDVTFSANRGEMIALVGPSGAGKSTLFSLLLGLYSPQQGQIFLEGLDQRQVSPEVWRQYFGYLPQEPVIFTGTLAENISLAKPKASEFAIWHALEKAELAAFVKSLPRGIYTPIGTGGLILSIGQKQRLALARVILRDPQVLLLDEPTTALDALAEQQVQASLNQFMAGRTTLVIAHRLKTILRAQRIVLLNKGRVEAIGTHGELVSEENTLYHQLIQADFAAEVANQRRLGVGI